MLWWLAQNTLLAGMLALAAGLACRFLRLSPAVRHAMWLVVLVKLITPPVALYSLPAGDAWIDWLLPSQPVESRATRTFLAEALPPEAVAATARTIEIETIEASRIEATAETFSPKNEGPSGAFFRSSEAEGLLDAGSPRFAEAAPSAAATADESSVSIGAAESRIAAIHFLIAGAWAIGAALMVLLQTARLIGLVRLLRGTEAAPDWLTELVREIAAGLQVRPPRVALTRAVCSPLICALGQPRLIWPKSLADPLTGEARRAVIAHELAHLRRRDHWVGWVELVASCGWWWNPLFWHVRRQLRENAELACDAWVVSLLPGGRRAYARTLVEISELLSWTAAPAPAVGMGASARHLFERRLSMILREHVPCRAPLAGLTLIGLLGIAVLPGWTKGQAPISGDALPKAESAAEFAAPENRDAADPAPAIATRAEPAATPRGPSSEESPRLDSSSDADSGPATAREDRPRSEGGAEPDSAAPQDFAFPVRKRLPQGLLLQQADRHAAQIQQLERQLAELTAAVQALRNEGHLPNDASPDPNRRGRVNFTADDAREFAETIRRGPVVMIDLRQPKTDHRVRVPAPGQIRLRVHDGFAVTRIDFDNPRVFRLGEQSPHEVVLVAVQSGVAIVKLWDDQDNVYTLHAEVDGGRTDGALRTGETIDLAQLREHEREIVKQRAHAATAGEATVLKRLLIVYRLPEASARALAAFLQEFCRDIVGTKFDGDALIVYASADAQARIRQFIQLLEPAPQRHAPPAPRQRSSNAHDPFSTPPVAAPPTPATTPGVDLGVLPPATPAPATPPPPLGEDGAKPDRGAGRAR